MRAVDGEAEGAHVGLVGGLRVIVGGDFLQGGLAEAGAAGGVGIEGIELGGGGGDGAGRVEDAGAIVVDDFLESADGGGEDGFAGGHGIEDGVGEAFVPAAAGDDDARVVEEGLEGFAGEMAVDAHVGRGGGDEGGGGFADLAGDGEGEVGQAACHFEEVGDALFG